MNNSTCSRLVPLALAVGVLLLGVSQGDRALAQNGMGKSQMPQMTPQQMAQQRVTPAQRKAAADALKATQAAAVAAGAPILAGPAGGLVTDSTGALVPDYLGGVTPNWAFSPQPATYSCTGLVPPDPAGCAGLPTGAIIATSGGIHKFIDSLPNLVIATPDVVTYPGTDYYEIVLGEYSWPFGTDLAATPTKLRGYRQTNNGTDAGCTKPPAPPAVLAGACAIGNNTVAPPATFSYLGPTIIATKGRPTRIKFTNNLPAGADGNLFFPVDTTVMGAGKGPDGTNYPQNRGTLHLHGGFTPWVSDGTAHQWVTPASETATLKTGVSTQPVPDMALPNGDSMTFYWPNEQSGRLMFYHDHAYGITRLNVYAGEAAGYLLVDPTERGLTDGTPTSILPGTVIADIPLVIQDKTFVWGTRNTGLACGQPDLTATGVFLTDPTWCDPLRKWAQAPGSLWFPHVYMPNQNPADPSGANSMGRFDYAHWFWPPYLGLIAHGEVQDPYGPAGQMIPGTPNPSLMPEALMDTPVVNGAAYPTLHVTDPTKPVRLRILNAANDRFQNLSLWVAADKTTRTTSTTIPGLPTASQVLCRNNATVSPANCTEVAMVPFNSTQNAAKSFPPNWYTPGNPIVFDDRAGGVPDPATRGPAMIQIGNEGGLLPAPAVVLNQPVNYTYNPKNIVVLSVQEHALLLGPAERADVIVDFSAFAGHTLILYNDSPAPIPAYDQRLDYYTGGGGLDQTGTGGTTMTMPGYGPNTRTIMQIVVDGAPGAGTPDYVNSTLCTVATFAQGDLGPFACATGSLTTALPAAFRFSQDPIIVPQAAYNTVYGTSVVDATGVSLSRISDTSLTYAPLAPSCVPGTTNLTDSCVPVAAPTTFSFRPKAIQELFELDYGRMNATLGVELPFSNAGNQTTIPLNYIDPTTEFVDTSGVLIKPPTGADGTQIWKITHNGVDTHAIHFHLFNVQVINRVGWDGAILTPELNELGWKETVRMNPLQDIIVALKPTTPKIQFGLPDSIRPMDVTSPVGTSGQFSPFDALGNPVTTVNALANFGWEYVWHCHLLGHEENDMMRPIAFNAMSLAPAAPALSPATAVGAGGGAPVRLIWTDATPLRDPPVGDPHNEIGFLVQRGPKGGGAGAFTTIATLRPYDYNPLCDAVRVTNCTAPAGTTDSIRYDDPTAGGNTSYRYQVVAYNSAGTSTSNIQTAVTAGFVPAAPTALTATVLSATQIRLNWTDNATNETGFQVLRGGTLLTTLGAHGGTGAMTYTDTPPPPMVGQTYTYTVIAVNVVGGVPYPSTPASVTITASIPAPTNLTATLLSASSIRLNWTDNAVNEANYRVARTCTGATCGATAFTPVLLPANTVTYTNSALLFVGNTYVYTVTAINGAVTSAAATVSVLDNVPNVPTSLVATAVRAGGNNDTVTLTWMDNSNTETSSTIQRCTGTAAACSLPAAVWTSVTTTVPANATTYTQTGVARATTYNYRIRAVNIVGFSLWSNTATVLTP